MQTKRSAVSAIVAVVIVVILVAAAGAGIYFLTMSGGTSSTNSTTSTGGVSTTTSTTTSHSSTSTTSTNTTPSTTSTTGSVSSTSTTATSSATTQTSTEFTCTTTYTTATSTIDYTPQYIGLIQKFSSIEFTISDNNGTVTQNTTLSYQVVGSNGGVRDVNFTLFANGTPTYAEAAVDVNANTVLWVDFTGYNATGSVATSFFDDLMGFFGLQYTYQGLIPELTSTQYFHSTGTSSMTFGQATFDVTTWVANSLPLNVDSCGYTATLTDYTLQFGTPPGTSLTFITFMHIAETAPQTDDITFKLVSMTLAS